MVTVVSFIYGLKHKGARIFYVQQRLENFHSLVFGVKRYLPYFFFIASILTGSHFYLRYAQRT